MVYILNRDSQQTSARSARQMRGGKGALVVVEVGARLEEQVASDQLEDQARA